MTRNKILYYSTNITLILTMPAVIFFVLAGIDIALDLKSLWGFVFMMIGAGYVMICGVVTAIAIKHNFL